MGKQKGQHNNNDNIPCHYNNNQQSAVADSFTKFFGKIGKKCRNEQSPENNEGNRNPQFFGDEIFLLKQFSHYTNILPIKSKALKQPLTKMLKMPFIYFKTISFSPL